MSTVPNTRLTQQTADKLLALISECRQTAREAAQAAVRHVGSAMPEQDIDGAAWDKVKTAIASRTGGADADRITGLVAECRTTARRAAIAAMSDGAAPGAEVNADDTAWTAVRDAIQALVTKAPKRGGRR